MREILGLERLLGRVWYIRSGLDEWLLERVWPSMSEVKDPWDRAANSFSISIGFVVIHRLGVGKQSKRRMAVHLSIFSR